jgi:hypothetical protein
MSYGIKLLVEGERACFTRPEMKVERVSYGRVGLVQISRNGRRAVVTRRGL